MNPPFFAAEPPHEYTCNPYPALTKIRQIDPRYYCPHRNTWFLSDYADIIEFLQDIRTTGTSLSDKSATFRGGVVNRLRSWFATSRAELDEIVDQVTLRCLGRMASLDEAELVESLARAIPAEVMGQLLGIPEPIRPQLARMAMVTLDGFDLDWPGKAGPSLADMRFLHAFFERHYAAGQETALMELLRRAQRDHALPNASMVEICMKLFTAGTTTTAACMANILAQLIAETPAPAEWINPTCPERSVEALIHANVPILALKRTIVEDLTFGSLVLVKNQKVHLMIASANSGAASRGDGPVHLSFGHGRFHCLGAGIARVEIASMLKHIGLFFAKIESTAPVTWRKAWLVHEAEEIRVRLERAERGN